MNYLIKKSDTLNSISNFLFLFGMSLFFFDFITINLTEVIKYELKGYELILGKTYVNQSNIVQYFPVEFWGIFTFLNLTIGLFVGLLNNIKLKPYLFLLSLAGIIGLLLLQIKFHFDYTLKNSHWTNITFENTYWILIINYAVIGCISFIDNIKTKESEIKTEHNKSTININIITQEKSNK